MERYREKIKTASHSVLFFYLVIYLVISLIEFLNQCIYVGQAAEVSMSKTLYHCLQFPHRCSKAAHILIIDKDAKKVESIYSRK